MKKLLGWPTRGLMLWILGTQLLANQLIAAELKILTENLPPFNMSTNGKNYARDQDVTGLSTDIVKALCIKAAIDCKITLKFPWQRIYTKALNSENYAVFSTSRLPDREASFHWIGPLVVEKWVLLAKSDSAIELATLQDVGDYSVGGYQEDAIADYLESKAVTVIRSSDNRINVDKLVRGHLDLWATGSISGPYFAKEVDVVGLKEVLTFHNDQMWLAINKKTDPNIIAKLKRALVVLREQGELDQLAAKYR